MTARPSVPAPVKPISRLYCNIRYTLSRLNGLTHRMVDTISTGTITTTKVQILAETLVFVTHTPGQAHGIYKRCSPNIVSLGMLLLVKTNLRLVRYRWGREREKKSSIIEDKMECNLPVGKINCVFVWHKLRNNINDTESNQKTSMGFTVGSAFTAHAFKTYRKIQAKIHEQAHNFTKASLWHHYILNRSIIVLVCTFFSCIFAPHLINVQCHIIWSWSEVRSWYWELNYFTENQHIIWIHVYM